MKELRKTTKISVAGVLALMEIECMLNTGPELYCTNMIPMAEQM
jgi:hypothetical protein